MMYVDGALTYSDQVVISSNKIISEGDRVRIEKLTGLLITGR